MRTLIFVVLLHSHAALSQERAQERPPAPDTPPDLLADPPAPASVAAAAADNSDDAGDKTDAVGAEQAPEVFTPSEQLSEDKDISFPVDI